MVLFGAPYIFLSMCTVHVAMGRLSAAMGTEWICRHQRDSHHAWQSLETRHRAFQQVSNDKSLLNIFIHNKW